ncbi:MAG: hypothetical protein ACNA8W_17705, partial [Bradymonadaceae bacterium]
MRKALPMTVLEPVDGVAQAVEWIEPLPADDLRRLRHCPLEPFDTNAHGPQSNAGLELIGTPRHHVRNLVATVGMPLRIQAHMAYGQSRSSLHKEWVRLFLGDCQGWRQIAHRKTDESGRVEFALPERLPVGVYGIAAQVAGDQTYATGSIWIIPQATPVVVFALPGALMAEEGLARSMAQGLGAPPIAGAASLTHFYREQGVLVIYMTKPTESYGPGASPEGWLQRHGFAQGPILMGPEALDTAPPSSFNQAVTDLDGLHGAKMIIKGGYAGSASDVQALLQLGVPTHQIWALDRYYPRQE